MSSLLQFQGVVDRKGVHLICWLAAPENSPHKFPDPRCHYAEPDANGNPKLYEVIRRPVGMLGCWVQFRINEKVIAPDLSCPFGLPVLPSDARALTKEESDHVWRS